MKKFLRKILGTPNLNFDEIAIKLYDPADDKVVQEALKKEFENVTNRIRNIN